MSSNPKSGNITAGIGDPYWYEWSIGLLKAVEMLNPDSGIEAVAFQKEGIKGWDDVVIRYESGHLAHYQVKHSAPRPNLTFSSLVASSDSEPSLLMSLSAAWRDMGLSPDDSTCTLITNRSAGSRASKTKSGIFYPPLAKFIPHISKELENATSLEDVCVPDEWQDAWKVWLAEMGDLTGEEKFNFLKALSITTNAPQLDEMEDRLREHYRCHPKIIQFCNQKFYGGDLLIMTRDQGEPDVIKAYVTVAGHHARGLVNQRQVDEIMQSILPELGSFPPDAIGIISPYRAQTSKIREAVGALGIEVDTVHKYQGREKRVIIISTVSNEANDFVDDPNLLNVAISRAQDKLRLVVSKEMEEGRGNIAEFVNYIRYNNFEVVPGKVRSVFDLLYREYTAQRLEVLRQKRKVSIYDSENLAYLEIESVLQEKAYREFSITLQFPLSTLIKDTSCLTPEETAYASHPWTRADFLIYRKVDKSPVLVIEVDGYAFHRKGSRQAERDVLKDSVLNKAGVPILRLSTTGSNERVRIAERLRKITR